LHFWTSVRHPSRWVKGSYTNDNRNISLGPLAEGHTLIIPKYHSEKLHEVPDQYLADILTLAKKIALSTGLADYNILQVRPTKPSVDHSGADSKQLCRATGQSLSSTSLTSIST